MLEAGEHGAKTGRNRLFLGQEKGIDSYISQLLESLGLSNCCDRRIGGATLNGISNGERKRVSIGVELITRWGHGEHQAILKAKALESA